MAEMRVQEGIVNPVDSANIASSYDILEVYDIIRDEDVITSLDGFSDETKEEL